MSFFTESKGLHRGEEKCRRCRRNRYEYSLGRHPGRGAMGQCLEHTTTAWAEKIIEFSCAFSFLPFRCSPSKTFQQWNRVFIASILLYQIQSSSAYVTLWWRQSALWERCPLFFDMCLSVCMVWSDGIILFLLWHILRLTTPSIVGDIATMEQDTYTVSILLLRYYQDL